jgi:hypothetical protein
MEHGCLQIMNVDGVLGHIIAKVISFAINFPRIIARTRQPDR